MWNGGEWFAGTVKDFDATSDTPHYVVYDDGDVKWHHLGKEEAWGQLNWLGDAPRRPTAASVSKRVPPQKRPDAVAAKSTKSAEPSAEPSAEAPVVVPLSEWHTTGHQWVEQRQRARRTVWTDQTVGTTKRSICTQVVDGTLTRWLPAGADPVEENALWYMEFDEREGSEADAEQLDEEEALEAILAMQRGLYVRSYKDLITEYVTAGVRYVDAEDGSVSIEYEALPDGLDAPTYFGARDLYVGNMYGHTGGIFELASSHVRHKTTSCRDPYVVVLPAQPSPLPFVRCEKWTDSPHVSDMGWPAQHKAASSIMHSGVVRGGMCRTQATMFAAIRWPASYEFIRPTKQDWNWNKVVKQNDGVVTHMLGEAVMPAMASEIIRQAANTHPEQRLAELVDLFCCGGGFSLGAVEATPGLTRLTGVDVDPIVLRNYEHNLRRLLPEATVVAREQHAPSTWEELCEMLGRTIGTGAHVHASPPCQGHVHHSAAKADVTPYLALMLTACKAGCSCSFEEHARVKTDALAWLAKQPAADAELLHVYEVTARSYGSPTGRERCVITTFSLVGETRLN